MDAPLALALHDLDMRKHRLQRQALEQALLRQFESLPVTGRVAETLLDPPAPPRLAVQLDPDRVRPAGDAPVTVLAFCNYESPHCRRLQTTLAQVLPLYPGVVRYAERDLPLEFHRHAGKAAEAARCALEQGNYWRFHDALYAAVERPDREALDRAARAADLDMKAYAGCLDGGRTAPGVAADVALARSLGLSTVPAVFVNGLYASPDVQPADLVWLIDRELAALGQASPRLVPAAADSNAPFRLQGFVASAAPGQGLALLAPSTAPEQVGAFREGDLVATGLVLRRITDSRIELLANGEPGRMTFDTRPPAPAIAAMEPDPRSQYRHRGVPVTLSRQRVLVLLSDRIALTDALEPVPMTVNGQHLLQVVSVPQGGLYELLGFQPGDVITLVNEQPVTEVDNPLWEALEKEGEVRVAVIRQGGLAQHFTYRFDD